MRLFKNADWLAPDWLVGRWYALVLGIVGTLAVTQLIGTGEDIALEPGELVIISGQDDSTGGQHQALIDQWNATHPRNPARVIQLSPIADAAHSEMVARAQSTKPDVDIYNLDVTWTAEFAEAGYLRALDQSTVDSSAFLQNPIKTCDYEGRLWCLPFNTNAGLLYYRTDKMPAPPGSWAQLVRIVDSVFADPGRDSRLLAGYAGQLARYEGLTVNALEAIHAAAPGSDVVRNGKITVELPDIKLGIERLAPSGVVLSESLDYDELGSTQAFRDGKVLFMRNWPIAYRQLTAAADDGQPDAPAVQFKVAPLPGASVLGGENLAISAKSARPKAAQALIEFLTDARSQQILFERGGFAATREVVYQDAEVRRQYPYAPTLLQAIQKAKPRPVTPCYNQFTEAFQTAVHQALSSSQQLPDDFIHTLESALKC